eukprot:5418673-Prymnesium_polylepis.1
MCIRDSLALLQVLMVLCEQGLLDLRVPRHTGDILRRREAVRARRRADSSRVSTRAASRLRRPDRRVPREPL